MAEASAPDLAEDRIREKIIWTIFRFIDICTQEVYISKHFLSLPGIRPDAGFDATIIHTPLSFEDLPAAMKHRRERGSKMPLKPF
jgi:hypothetical protein